MSGRQSESNTRPNRRRTWLSDEYADNVAIDPLANKVVIDGPLGAYDGSHDLG